MSKPTYHVPQPGEVIEFTSSANISYIQKAVEKWDSKHGYLTTKDGSRYLIKDRSSIKLVLPAMESAAHPDEEALHFAYAPAEIGVDMSAKHTVTLPTSFASNVERAQAIADADAEEKWRREASSAEFERLTTELERVKRELGELSEIDRNADEDHQHRIDYLRSLRVRGE